MVKHVGFMGHTTYLAEVGGCTTFEKLVKKFNTKREALGAARKVGDGKTILVHRKRANEVQRARVFLASCPPAISGQGGRAHAHQVFLKLARNFVLTEDQAVAALNDWQRSCLPGLSDDELRRGYRDALLSVLTDPW